MRDDVWAPRLHRVRRFERETPDVFTLTLEKAEGKPEPFAFRPGQFNMLYLFGQGEVPISISAGSETGLVHTIRGVGTITRGLGELGRGATIGVRGPFGSHWPVERARERDLVVVAGGIGLAPLRPVLHQVARERGSFRRAVLLYGARRPEDFLFEKEWKKWEKAGWEMRVTVDAADETWRGEVGVVTPLIDRIGIDGPRTTALLCGPEIMMKYSVPRLRAGGVEEAEIFVSLERNMKCAVGFCGHCQLGPRFLCKDGPVFAYSDVKDLLEVREL